MKTLVGIAALILLWDIPPSLLLSSSAAQDSRLPAVLFFANPMSSDNDVIRRPNPEVLSVAELIQWAMRETE